VSYSSLARDLEVSDKTIKRWLTVLENMYVIFRVTPYHRNLARALLKSPKFYFYDTGQVLGDEGVRLENVTACALFKEIQFRQDCFGDELQLHYLRTKAGREIDFFVTEEGRGKLMLEVKWADANRSRNFSLFDQHIPGTGKVQLVKELEKEKTYPDGTEVRQAHSWLSTFSLST
jgi:predicted AAA+ superfamily ATPase